MEAEAVLVLEQGEELDWIIDPVQAELEAFHVLRPDGNLRLLAGAVGLAVAEREGRLALLRPAGQSANDGQEDNHSKQAFH
jgi:hypothetical protein